MSAEVTVEQLVAIIEARGAKQADADIEAVRKRVSLTSQEFVGLGVAGTLALAALTRLVSGVQRLTAQFADVSGLNTAAEFRDIQLSLENLTGSAGAAHSIMAQLEDISLHSTFEVSELSRYAGELLNLGVTAKNVGGDLQKLVNLAAKFRVPGQEQGDFIQQIVALRDRGQLSPKMLQRLALRGNLGQIVGAGTGQKLTTNQAIRRLSGMRGEKAYAVLLKGAEALDQGAAAAAAMQSPLQLITTLWRQLAQIMEPTGQILLKFFMPIGGLVFALLDAARWLNAATGGVLGLTLILYGLLRAKVFLLTAYTSAIMKTRELTAALLAYSGAAGTASVRSAGAGYAAGNASAGAAAATAAKTTGFFGGLKSWFTGIRYQFALGGFKAGSMNLLREAGGLLKGFGGKALGLVKHPGILAMGADIGLNYLGDKIGGRIGGFMKGVGTGVGWGSLGFLTGNPVVGAITTAIGGIVGGIKGFLDGGDKEDANGELKKQTGILMDLRDAVIGGGQQVRSTVSEITAERTISRVLGV